MHEFLVAYMSLVLVVSRNSHDHFPIDLNFHMCAATQRLLGGALTLASAEGTHLNGHAFESVFLFLVLVSGGYGLILRQHVNI